MAADISTCPGVDSASKNEKQDIPGGKGGRCVRVTTLQPSCAECLVIWSLNRPEPSGPHRPVIGVALLFYIDKLHIRFQCDYYVTTIGSNEFNLYLDDKCYVFLNDSGCRDGTHSYPAQSIILWPSCHYNSILSNSDSFVT